MHRSASISTSQAFWLIAFGISMLLASLVFGLRASIDLWEKGYQGGRATVNGIVLSVLLLIPFGIQLSNALQFPQLNDVTTDVLAPPVYLAAVGSPNGEMPITEFDDLSARQIVSFYPELVSRRYLAPQERVAASALAILAQWDWKVTSSQNLPEVEAEKPEGEEEELAGAVAPGSESNEVMQDIIIQTEAKSFLMKLPSYQVIRLSSSDNTTLVDMRSISLWGKHDFGTNARNISQFLDALDLALAGLAGEI
jgi:hypothetical protein